MSGWRRHPEGDALAPPGGGGDSRPLNLIHTNNSPNPISMRVSRAFGGAKVELQGQMEFSDLERWRDFFSGPLGTLILRRAFDAKSTG